MSGTARPVPRLLALGTFVPFPEVGGDHVRVLGLLRSLSLRARLAFWCVAGPEGDLDGLRAALPEADVRGFPPDRIGTESLSAALARYGRAALSGTPAWIAAAGSARLAAEVRRTAGDWDGVLALGEAAASLLDGVERAWHWDKFNVQTTSLGAEFDWRHPPAVVLRDYANLAAARRYERRWAARAATVSVTNAVEAARYRRLFGGSPIELPTAVTLPPSPVRTPEPGRLLWLGSYRYRSNREGLHAFLAASWDRLADRFRLRVVGSGLTDDDRSCLRRWPNVEPVGAVPSLAEELGCAQLGVVPVWTGGGTRIKTLTMMAAGLPVVATPAGVEGIEPAGAPEYYLAVRPDDFAAAVTAAAGGDAEEVGRRGRERIRRNFTDDALAARYDRLVAAAIRGGTP